MSESNGTVKWVQFITALLVFAGIIAGVFSSVVARVNVVDAKTESYRAERLYQFSDIIERLARIETKVNDGYSTKLSEMRR